jgi:hypothetical protein
MGEVGGVLALVVARLGTPLRARPRAGGIERCDRGLIRCRLTRRGRLTRRWQRSRRCGLVRRRPVVIA